jgi:dTDP-glucose 4,6-dehydratase/UDP-glucose 4-epimerase
MKFLENSSMTPQHFNYDIAEDVEQAIVRSGVALEGFRGKTVLLTGGTGFFGIWMLLAFVQMKQILEGDLRILVVSRDPESFLKKHPQYHFDQHAEFIHSDVKNLTLTDVQVTHLVHMATTNAGETFAGEDQLQKLDLLYLGTRNVLEQCGPTLEKVLFTSSGVAYGRTPSGLITEENPSALDTTSTGSALGLGKLNAEYLMAYYAEKWGYKYSIARCFSFAGQYLPLNLHYAMGNFIANALAKQNILIKGNGEALRSYLYIGDALAWLLRLLAEPHNQIFNVGSEKSMSMQDLAKKVAHVTGLSKSINVMSQPQEIGNFRRDTYVPSVNKITTTYSGLREWTTVEESIQKMLWY